MDRRQFLQLAATSPASAPFAASGIGNGVGLLAGGNPLAALMAGLGSGLGLAATDAAQAATGSSDYRAVVCIFLSGGNDGNNCLIPVDGAYTDYSRARPDLAQAKDSLAKLNGSSAGHSFGMHAALAPLAGLYNAGRLAWLANVGPLVQPATARQVLDRAVSVPSFLLSHSDQVLWQQGWLGDADTSGWAGRALELLPGSLRHDLNAVTMTTNRTLVAGRNSPVTFLSPYDNRWWGQADILSARSASTQALNQLARAQFANQYFGEYSKTLSRSVQETTTFTQAAQGANPPAGTFGSDELAQNLKKLATLLPALKARGLKRQVFLLQWGSFDTHSGQLGSGKQSQDSQLALVARAMAAFDQSMQAAGMDQNVVSLMMTDFGRTLRQASGGGTDHAWGNHWFAMGGPVAGGQVLGTFPNLVLGGVDDMDRGKEGRFVPGTSTDQVAASLMQWLGLPAGQLLTVFPHLANFSQKTLPLIRS